LLVEWDATIARKIGTNTRALRNFVMQSRDAWDLGEHLLHPWRKSIEQAIDNLKER
jgi:hypothetical protein